MCFQGKRKMNLCQKSEKNLSNDQIGFKQPNQNRNYLQSNALIVVRNELTIEKKVLKWF